jgi:protein-disulfide isomerase
MNKKALFISVALVLVVTFIAAATLFNNQKNTTENAFVIENINALERVGAPIKGPQSAKVTIVEFFDPACRTCNTFHPLVTKLIKQYPGKVKVMMRYAPLHKGSDQVVKLLEAAHLQGQFWPVLEKLFETQQQWVVNHVSKPRRAQALLKTLSLDNEQLKADLGSAAVKDAIQQDLQDGATLNVRATPEFFVNGKPMPSFSYQQLSQLVAEAVAEVY